jgi:peptidoglycan hydrolase CwlO-like protein
MVYFGITRQEKKNRKGKWKQLNIAFFVLIFLCFIFFSFSSKISDVVFSKNKIDVFKDDLNHLAFSFRAVDKNLSQFLMKIDDIQKAYASGDNILKTKEKEIDECLTYIQDNKEYLKKM